MQGECRAELARAMLSRSPRSQSISLMLCKFSYIFWMLQALICSETRYGTLWALIGTYTIYFALFSCISRGFFIPSRHTTKRTASWIQLANLWAEWSWHSFISPTSSRIRLGRNSEVCWQMILPRVTSHSWIAARFCRRKSILFTNAWDTRKVACLQGFQRTWGLHGANPDFNSTNVHLLYVQNGSLRFRIPSISIIYQLSVNIFRPCL